MKIGITERGDASLDFGWVDKMHIVDGAILITKNVSSTFIQTVMQQAKPVIVHATCTGWGGTWLEPRVPDYKTQLNNIQSLLAAGFPKSHIVLRIDPIIPTDEGVSKACAVIEEAKRIGLLPGMRVRVSVLDEYPHVRARIKTAGYEPFLNGYFQASYYAFSRLDEILSEYEIDIETCAEPYLDSSLWFERLGCVSEHDLKIMGLPIEESFINPQNRKGCLCLSCKTELLTNKHPCAHGCLYCYWKD